MKKLIDITRIERDHATQIRVELDPALVKEYAAIVAEHEHMAPVSVFTPDPENITKQSPIILADGFHRIEAYLACGREQIPAEIFSGGKSEALAHAIDRNCRNGLRMTNADKRNAASLAVADAVLGELPDAKLAKKIGVSTSLINEVRRGVTKEAKRKRAKTVAVDSHTRSAPEPAEGHRPTRKKCLDQIRTWLLDELIEEGDVIELFEEKESHYRFVSKPGGLSKLKVLGKNGRSQVEVPVVVKLISGEELVVKYEGPGALGVSGE